jgi:hypothetical protein
VPFDREQVKNAPSVDPEDELSQDEPHRRRGKPDRSPAAPLLAAGEPAAKALEPLPRARVTSDSLCPPDEPFALGTACEPADLVEERGRPVSGHQYLPGGFSILRVSRGSTNGSLSSGWPASMARPRSSSALNSAPSRIMMFEIQSQTRKMIGPASAP